MSVPPVRCTWCGAWRPAAGPCPSCGLAWQPPRTPCPTCHTINEADAKFCAACGQALPAPGAMPAAYPLPVVGMPGAMPVDPVWRPKSGVFGAFAHAVTATLGVLIAMIAVVAALGFIETRETRIESLANVAGWLIVLGAWLATTVWLGRNAGWRWVVGAILLWYIAIGTYVYRERRGSLRRGTQRRLRPFPGWETSMALVALAAVLFVAPFFDVAQSHADATTSAATYEPEPIARALGSAVFRDPAHAERQPDGSELSWYDGEDEEEGQGAVAAVDFWFGDASLSYMVFDSDRSAREYFDLSKRYGRESSPPGHADLPAVVSSYDHASYCEVLVGNVIVVGWAYDPTYDPGTDPSLRGPDTGQYEVAAIAIADSGVTHLTEVASDPPARPELGPSSAG